MEKLEVLQRDSYCELVETLAEAAFLLTQRAVGNVTWEDHSEDLIDKIDRMIFASGLLKTDSPYILALSPNWDAFWSEYLPEEIDDLIREQNGAGDLMSFMAYYAMQADVICSVKFMVNTLDITPVIE